MLFQQQNILTSDPPLIIERYQLMPYNVRLKTPWQTAAATLFFRQGLLVKLSINESLFAIGECAPMEEIGTESLAQAQQFLDKKLSSISGKAIDLQLLSDMDLFPACRFALETAFLSLMAQHKRTNITHLLNPEKSNTGSEVKVNAMLGGLNKDLLLLATQAEAQGFKCLKIKAGLNTIKHEAEILKHLLQQISPSTLIRLDANKSWSCKETEWLLNFLKPYENQIDSIEEPLKIFDQIAYQYLQNMTNINLALDESVTLSSINKLPVKQLVLKPMAWGGIIKPFKLARQAQQSKIKTVITSSIETAHGLWPIVHLCAAINNEQFHGLATAAWLEDTLTEPPEINHGIITV